MNLVIITGYLPSQSADVARRFSACSSSCAPLVLAKITSRRISQYPIVRAHAPKTTSPSFRYTLLCALVLFSHIFFIERRTNCLPCLPGRTTMPGSNSTRGGGRMRSTKASSAGWRCTGAAAGKPSGSLYPLAAHSRSKHTPGSTSWGVDLNIQMRYVRAYYVRIRYCVFRRHLLIT